MHNHIHHQVKHIAMMQPIKERTVREGHVKLPGTPGREGQCITAREGQRGSNQSNEQTFKLS